MLIDPDAHVAADRKRNPFPQYDPKTGTMGWRWRDEHGVPHHKLYKDQMSALYDLLNYMKYLNDGPSLWQQLWWPVRYGLWTALMKKVRG